MHWEEGGGHETSIELDGRESLDAINSSKKAHVGGIGSRKLKRRSKPLFTMMMPVAGIW